MALDYDGSNTGIFDRGGKLIKYVNSRLATATTALPAELKAIADKFEAADMTGQISGLFADYDGFQDNVTRERQAIARYWDAILTDRVSVLEELGVPSPDVAAVLPALIRQMIADAETVDASTVAIGTVTANAANVGNGTVLMSKLLDGYNAPLSGAPVVLNYAGVNSELAVNETMTFTCVSDSSRDGLTSGTEGFSWVGGIAGEKLGFEDEGSGEGPNLTTAGTSTIVTNNDFEDWTSNVPTGWTAGNGTAGTHIKESTAEYYRGSSSLHFDGDNSQADIRVDYAVAAGTMQSRRLYCVSVRVKASAASGTGGLTVMFTGTNYTASSTEKITITAGAMPTSWTLYSFWIVTPANIPSDWTLKITNTGTPGLTSNVYVDSLTCEPGTYHGGLAACVVPGSTPFAVGDRFTAAITNDAAGTIQEFFRKWYAAQLPSVTDGSETIADSLAT